MTVEETRWMGGEKTSQTHGEAFYGQIGRKGGQKLKKPSKKEGTPKKSN